MLDAIIRGSLGEAGSALLDLYLENAYWVNSIVLLYIILLLLSKRGYRKIIEAIISSLVDIYGEDVKSKNENWFKRTLEVNDLDWKLIANQTRIPIVTNKSGLGFQIKNPDNLKEFFTPEKIFKAINKDY